MDRKRERERRVEKRSGKKERRFDQNFQPTASSSGLMPIVPGPGAEFADFGDRDLMFGLTSEEAWVNLSEDDLLVRSMQDCFNSRMTW